MMKKNGFTLVELSIVLIIIGLIIGGILKGTDLIGSADQKKAMNTWVKGWIVAANTYEDRTGSVLADGTANGGTEDSEDGICDNKDVSEDSNVQDRLRSVGIDIPKSNIANSDGAYYALRGKYQSTKAVMILGSKDSKNALYIKGVPSDIAMAFDTIIDGKVDGKVGNVIEENRNDWTNATEGKAENIYVFLNQ